MKAFSVPVGDATCYACGGDLWAPPRPSWSLQEQVRRVVRVRRLRIGRVLFAVAAGVLGALLRVGHGSILRSIAPFAVERESPDQHAYLIVQDFSHLQMIVA